MNVTYRCPSCDQTVRVDFDASTASIACPACESVTTIPKGALDGDEVKRCFICRGDDLFVRKNFSQRIGVSIIVTGFVISSVFYYYYMIRWALGVLFVSALVDLALYLVVGNLLQCYRCHSEYRGVAGLEEQEAFSLETHERYRQQAARNAESPPVGNSEH